MNKYITASLLLIFTAGCTRSPECLYRGEAFAIYPDRVVQGPYESKVISRTHLVSNYISTASEHYSRLITFKFSINEKDNEKPSGDDHWLIIREGEHLSPVIRFGQEDKPNPGDPGTRLPPNYAFTFRLDMRPVLEQFNEKGYFETFDGTRIAKEDFKQVYLAGGSEPLSWDFSNLDEHGLALKDPDGDGIYELSLVLNPVDTTGNSTREWKLTEDISMKPRYKSDQPIVDALFNLSLEEARKNIEPDSTLRTGAKWGGVWTRDVSYSTLLAFAYHEPEVAKISLLKKVRRDRIIQDTGSGGAWPVSSDRTTWALAAWEIYKVTGDQEWLKTASTIIKNTLDDDYRTLRDEKTGMYHGESSFLDWREQTYPKWMTNADIYASENLGTNAVHYQAHLILAEMLKLQGQPYQEYVDRAKEIKEGINSYLWMADKGYYGQYLYGRAFPTLSPRFEALGEALAVLFDVADSARASLIFRQSPVTTFGTSCIFPQIPGIPPYHNNAIWPFVQSYWNLAAAKAGNEEALLHGLASIYRAGALFLTNYENMVAQTGDYVGTEINSDRMLWSMAGNLAMVHRLFMGMRFEVNGISFSPVIPRAYGGTRTLSNFHYRDAVLSIRVTGYGNEIASILLDGKPLENALFPARLAGEHRIDIRMKDNPFPAERIHLVPNAFSLPDPHVRQEGKLLSWEKIPGAVQYRIYRNGLLTDTTEAHSFEVNRDHFAEYKVSAVDSAQWESFTSEPTWIYPAGDEQIVEVENYVPQTALPYTNFSGKGFVETSLSMNTDISIPVTVAESGNYLIDFRYSNGTGPWNTDNNCAIRSLYVNGNYRGVEVFPQRGQDEWSDWGFSNSRIIQLHRGENRIGLKFEVWNTNMDGEINTALLDYLRIIKLD